MSSKPATNEDLLQLLSQTFVAIPFNKMLGLRLDSLDTTHVSMSFCMKNELIGNFMQGILHGGVISSVLDMAGGMTVMASAINRNTDKSHDELVAIVSKCSTVDLTINYLNPGRGEIFFADAWLLKSGKLLSFTRMELHNHEKKLIATATGTYLMR